MANQSVKKKAWMSWSTGKDSAFALWRVQQQSHFEITGLLTTVTGDYERVYMHAVRNELLDRQAEALGLPLHKVTIPAKCSNEIYEQRMGDAIRTAASQGVTHMIFGDLFLENIRSYRIDKLAGTGIEPVFPL